MSWFPLWRESTVRRWLKSCNDRINDLQQALIGANKLCEDLQKQLYKYQSERVTWQKKLNAKDQELLRFQTNFANWLSEKGYIASLDLAQLIHEINYDGHTIAYHTKPKINFSIDPMNYKSVHRAEMIQISFKMSINEEVPPELVCGYLMEKVTQHIEAEILTHFRNQSLLK